jgi:hypothetical protein
MAHDAINGYPFALAETWPFFSDASVSEGTVGLVRTRHGLLDGSTQRLANALEHELRTRAGGTSLDVLSGLRDNAWFNGLTDSNCSLVTLLFRIAERTVSPHGDRATLNRDGDFCGRLEQYRWLALLLPPDILIAARYAQSPGIEPPCDRLTLTSPLLSSMLQDAPVSETHLHLGAAVPFELLWTGLMGSLRASSPRFSNEGMPPPFGSATSFLTVLTCAAIGRLVLASFLRENQRGGCTSLAAFASSALGAMASSMQAAAGPASEEAALHEALRGLLTCAPPKALKLARLSQLYKRLAGAIPSRQAEQLDELVARDPLATWLPAREGRALPETRFLTLALSYLDRQRGKDSSFERLFWQYVRVRNKVFGYLVEQPGTAGLDWFTRHYNRIWPLRQSFKKVQIAVALESASRDTQLGSLEGRTVPESRWAAVRDELRQAAYQAFCHQPAPGMPRPEIGVVLHFLKATDEKRGRQRRLHADPRQIAHGVRFGAWSYARLKEAFAIERALREHPELLVVLRGIDVAATELSVPTWPLVPLFHRVREASLHAASVLARRAPRLRVTPLRVTCHAGEDYGRLVEGLRRVHELIETGILSAGDRIGHGLCLGHAPADWARRARVVSQPKEERLDDLLWEIDRAVNGDFDVAAGRLASAEGEAERVAREIYGSDVRVDDLRRARRRRGDRRELDRLGFPFLDPTRCGDDREQQLLLRYLSDAGVFLRGRVPVNVNVTEAEVIFLQNAQGWLRRQLAAREITIESNPSSNLLIGDFRSLQDHPSFRLQPLPGDTPSNETPLPLSINSDDPVSFATSLGDEFAYLHAAILRQGVGSAQAITWLQARRQDGYRSRFTLASSADPRVLRWVARAPTATRVASSRIRD